MARALDCPWGHKAPRGHGALRACLGVDRGPSPVPGVVGHGALRDECCGAVVGGGGCAPGRVLVDLSLPAEVRIATDSVATPPTHGVYEIPVGAMPDCANLRLLVSADCQAVGGSTAIHAYLNDSGLALNTRDFIFGDHTPSQLANIPANSDGAYHSATFVVYPTLAPPYVDFAGPLAAQSVYLWPPALFPAFSSATWNVKNVRVRIITV